MSLGLIRIESVNISGSGPSVQILNTNVCLQEEEEEPDNDRGLEKLQDTNKLAETAEGKVLGVPYISANFYFKSPNIPDTERHNYSPDLR